MYFQSKRQKAKPKFLYIKIIYYTYAVLKKNIKQSLGLSYAFILQWFICISIIKEVFYNNLPWDLNVSIF